MRGRALDPCLPCPGGPEPSTLAARGLDLTEPASCSLSHGALSPQGSISSRRSSEEPSPHWPPPRNTGSRRGPMQHPGSLRRDGTPSPWSWDDDHQRGLRRSFLEVSPQGLGWKLGVAILVSRGLGSSFYLAPTSRGRDLPWAGPQRPRLYNAALALPPLTLCNSVTVGCQSQEGYKIIFYDFLSCKDFTGELSRLLVTEGGLFCGVLRFRM